MLPRRLFIPMPVACCLLPVACCLSQQRCRVLRYSGNRCYVTAVRGGAECWLARYCSSGSACYVTAGRGGDAMHSANTSHYIYIYIGISFSGISRLENSLLADILEGASFIPTNYVIPRYLRFLVQVTVTKAWRVRTLRLEDTAPHMECRCEYIEYAISDSRKWVILEPGV
jgi:hypothetical protein